MPRLPRPGVAAETPNRSVGSTPMAISAPAYPRVLTVESFESDSRSRAAEGLRQLPPKKFWRFGFLQKFKYDGVGFCGTSGSSQVHYICPPGWKHLFWRFAFFWGASADAKAMGAYLGDRFFAVWMLLLLALVDALVVGAYIVGACVMISMVYLITIHVLVRKKLAELKVHEASAIERQVQQRQTLHRREDVQYGESPVSRATMLGVLRGSDAQEERAGHVRRRLSETGIARHIFGPIFADVPGTVVRRGRLVRQQTSWPNRNGDSFSVEVLQAAERAAADAVRNQIVFDPGEVSVTGEVSVSGMSIGQASSTGVASLQAMPTQFPTDPSQNPGLMPGPGRDSNV